MIRCACKRWRYAHAPGRLTTEKQRRGAGPRPDDAAASRGRSVSTSRPMCAAPDLTIPTQTARTVKVNGKRVTVRRARRLRSTVKLTKLPQERFTVNIVLRLADGRVVKGGRTYRTCRYSKSGRPRRTARDSSGPGPCHSTTGIRLTD